MKILSRVAAFLGLMLWAHAAGAVTVTIGAQLNGVGAITALASGSGSASYTNAGFPGPSTIGDWYVLSANGLGSPPLVNPDRLNSNTIDLNRGPDSGSLAALWLYVTVSGIANPNGGVDFLSFFSNNASVPTGWGIKLQTYLGPGNTVPATTGVLGTLLAQECFGAGPSCSSFPSGPINVGPGPYSITALYRVTPTATGGSSNLTINISATSAVPLPAALPLLASAFGGLGLLGWRRRKQSALAA